MNLKKTVTLIALSALGSQVELGLTLSCAHGSELPKCIQESKLFEPHKNPENQDPAHINENDTTDTNIAPRDALNPSSFGNNINLSGSPASNTFPNAMGPILFICFTLHDYIDKSTFAPYQGDQESINDFFKCFVKNLPDLGNENKQKEEVLNKLIEELKASFYKKAKL